MNPLPRRPGHSYLERDRLWSRLAGAVAELPQPAATPILVVDLAPVFRGVLAKTPAAARGHGRAF